MKTKILFLLLLTCALLHKPLIGLAARLCLKFGCHCQLAYDSIHWEKGKLVFSDLVVFDSTFHAHIERASLSIDFRELPRKLKTDLCIDCPHLSIIKKRELKKAAQSWFEFHVIVQDGTVEWDGLAQFSLNHSPKQTHLDLDWGESSLSLTLFENSIEAELRELKASMLKPFFPQIGGGALTGRVQLDSEYKPLSANLKVHQLSFGPIKGVEGSFSYNADLGAKWELQGEDFTCLGRGFFSHWLESEIEFANGAKCKISSPSEKNWNLECHQLQSHQIRLFQTLLAPVFPECASWVLAEGTINGRAQLSPEGGSIAIESEPFDLNVAGVWADWKGEVRILNGTFCVHGGWDGEKFPLVIEKGKFDQIQFVGKGWIDPSLDFFIGLNAEWNQIPCKCLLFSKKECKFAFDVRLEDKTWDLCRLAGSSNGKEIFFDEKSHILGNRFHPISSQFGTLDIAMQLPWKSVLAAESLIKKMGFTTNDLPLSGSADLHFQYQDQCARLRAKGIHLYEKELDFEAVLHADGKAAGHIHWAPDFAADFEGKITKELRCDFFLPKVCADLALSDIEGKVEGQGHLIYDGAIESDFDFSISSLKIRSLPFENEGIIHLHYSSDKGALFHGVHLHGPIDCIVDELEYDSRLSNFVFHQAQVHLPNDIHFTADLDVSSDFSSARCKGQDLFIQSHHLENFELFWRMGKCEAVFHYLGHPHQFRGNQKKGSFILGCDASPMTIDWEYDDAFSISSIEGSFAGIDASFHAETPTTLIGSARVDFSILKEIVPAGVAEVFEELKMGKGYELLGRLKIEKNLPHFCGLLSGKHVELFGFQFLTLLAQLDFSLDRIDISDVLISDSAGQMKIDQIIVEDTPFTISIPTITITEMRPSLMQRPNEAVGPLSPLVVRELKLNDFKGLLDDSKTYTAKGNLHFINSYKREETVFDFPANVLSRIVGLDLELLIPVCGDLNFELKDGRFTITELTNSFSEAKRSQFFLETNPPPSMDLDGNLQIFVKMKQFVLFKLTESFLISIDGQLDDPQFHLQKKKRFFGLM